MDHTEAHFSAEFLGFGLQLAFINRVEDDIKY
jgi:hypothetical protein